jgi:hypothetical protein
VGDGFLLTEKIFPAEKYGPFGSSCVVMGYIVGDAP